jgi:hypothetical protein
MENKKISYFSNAIEFLAAEINNQDVEEFYQSCIEVLATQERLEKPALKDLFRGKEKSDKTYGNYLDKLIELLNKFKVEIASRNADLEFNKRPIIKKQVGGGSGNATYYSIAFEEQNDENPAILKKRETPVNTLNGDITYRTKSLKRTPWYLKITGKFFTKTKHRQIFLFSVLIYFIGAPIALGFLLAELPLWAWSLLLACYYFSFKPAWNIMHLSINKLTLLEHIFQPVGAVCISKVTNVNNKEEYLDIDREIMSVIVDGTCPVCLNQYSLKNSVQLENHSLFNRRIIGKCLNNPKEHKYSFDKDLMTGQRIENN